MITLLNNHDPGFTIMSEGTILIAAVIIILISATVSDIRSREIYDAHWVLLCIISVVLSIFVYDLGSALLFTLSVLFIVVYMFSPKVTGKASILILSLYAVSLIAAYIIPREPSFIVILIMSFFVLAMYWTGTIRGGADAKALISMSLLFPVYPEAGCLIWEPSYPAGYVFNPIFSTLLFASIFSMFTLVYVHHKNREVGCKGYTSYPMSIDKARGSFVWPVEDFENGEVVRRRTYDDVGDVYDRMEAAGMDTVRVTPMIPFLLPVTVAFAMVMVLGSPLFLLLF